MTASVGVAKAASVQHLVLFHHDPEHDNDGLERLERGAQVVFPQTVLAREGMTIEL